MLAIPMQATAPSTVIIYSAAAPPLAPIILQQS